MLPLPPISTLFPYTTLFRSFIAATGFDPRRDIHEIVMASPADLQARSGLVLVRGQFDSGRILTLYKAMKDRKSTRLNSSHQIISYAVFCLKKKKTQKATPRV